MGKELRSVLTSKTAKDELDKANAAMLEMKGKGKGKGKEAMEPMIRAISKLTDAIAEKYEFKGQFGEMLGSIKEAGERKNNTVIKAGFADLMKAIGAPDPMETAETS